MQGRNGGAVRRDSAALRARMLWVSFKKLHAHPHTHMSGTLVCRTTDASSLNLPIRNGHCLPTMARRAELAPCGRPDCQLWPCEPPLSIMAATMQAAIAASDALLGLLGQESNLRSGLPSASALSTSAVEFQQAALDAAGSAASCSDHQRRRLGRSVGGGAGSACRLALLLAAPAGCRRPCQAHVDRLTSGLHTAALCVHAVSWRSWASSLRCWTENFSGRARLAAVDTLQLAGGLAIAAICSREDAEGLLEGAALLMGSGRLCLEGPPHASGNGEDIESGLLLAGAHLQAACHLLQAIDRHRPGLNASAALVARIIRPAAAARWLAAITSALLLADREESARSGGGKYWIEAQMALPSSPRTCDAVPTLLHAPRHACMHACMTSC